MSALSPEQMATRERTLLAAVLLSMWAPLATGIAVILSRSTTQVADFVRRTVELAALVTSWQVFRRVSSNPSLAAEDRKAMERTVGVMVAAALCLSGTTIAALAIYRLTGGFSPGGNAAPGLAIAVLGVLTNSWFWRRYTVLVREQPDAILETQLRLYRAKTFVDICVAAALAMVVFWPGLALTGYVDISGSLAVSGYLVWSGSGVLRRGPGGFDTERSSQALGRSGRD